MTVMAGDRMEEVTVKAVLTVQLPHCIVKKLSNPSVEILL